MYCNDVLEYIMLHNMKNIKNISDNLEMLYKNCEIVFKIKYQNWIRIGKMSNNSL